MMPVETLMLQFLTDARLKKALNVCRYVVIATSGVGALMILTSFHLFLFGSTYLGLNHQELQTAVFSLKCSLLGLAFMPFAAPAVRRGFKSDATAEATERAFRWTVVNVTFSLFLCVFNIHFSTRADRYLLHACFTDNMERKTYPGYETVRLIGSVHFNAVRYICFGLMLVMTGWTHRLQTMDLSALDTLTPQQNRKLASQLPPRTSVPMFSLGRSFTVVLAVFTAVITVQLLWFMLFTMYAFIESGSLAAYGLTLPSNPSDWWESAVLVQQNLHVFIALSAVSLWGKLVWNRNSRVPPFVVFLVQLISGDAVRILHGMQARRYEHEGSSSPTSISWTEYLKFDLLFAFSCAAGLVTSSQILTTRAKTNLLKRRFLEEETSLSLELDDKKL